VTTTTTTTTPTTGNVLISFIQTDSFQKIIWWVVLFDIKSSLSSIILLLSYAIGAKDFVPKN
jgi:hypothetical protein